MRNSFIKRGVSVLMAAIMIFGIINVQGILTAASALADNTNEISSVYEPDIVNSGKSVDAMRSRSYERENAKYAKFAQYLWLFEKNSDERVKCDADVNSDNGHSMDEVSEPSKAPDASPSENPGSSPEVSPSDAPTITPQTGLGATPTPTASMQPLEPTPTQGTATPTSTQTQTVTPTPTLAPTSTPTVTPTPTPTPVAVTGILLDTNIAELTEGDTLTLHASVLPVNAENKDVVWESSDKLVATVDKGIVTALHKGTAIITAKTVDGGFLAYCSVAVSVKTNIVRFIDWDKSIIAEQLVEYKHAATEPKYPTRKGYTFAGWDKDFSCITEYTEINAIYNVTEYTIKYVSNGGDAPEKMPCSYNIETETFTLPIPKRLGYEFMGWYESPQLTGTKLEKIEKGTTGNKNLYAAWKLIVYTITYYPGNGVLPGDCVRTYTVEDGDVALPIPVRLGYEFSTWHMDSYRSDDGITVIKAGTTGNLELYASWNLITFRIVYHFNGGSCDTFYETTFTVESKDIALPTPVRSGYTFIGWYDNIELSGSKITKIAKGSLGNKEYYASWRVITYNISYSLNGGTNPKNAPESYTIESGGVTLPTPVKNGYKFIGWYDNSTFFGSPITSIKAGATGNKTFYAKWQVVTYSIRYYLNGGKNPSSVPESYTIESGEITLPTPTRTGYSFVGWYDNEAMTKNPIKSIAAGSYGDVKLYACWRAIEYTIKYVLRGGINPADAVTSYTIESESIALPKPEKNAYTFTGWYGSSMLTGTPVVSIAKGSTGNKTFYAAWTPTVYKITYELNGGVNPPDAVTKYTVESDEIKLLSPEKNGHFFVGWYDNAEFRNMPILTIPTGSFGDLTLYARFNPKLYTVKFFDWDGKTLIGEQRVLYGKAAIAPEVLPEHVGYTFAGWNEDISCVKSDMNVIAMYAINVYEVIFTDYDTTVLEKQYVKHGDAAIAPSAPKHEGMVFVFWSVDFSCVKSDLTVQAVYRATQISDTPMSNAEFLKADSIESGCQYIMVARDKSGKAYALSNIQYSGGGLWAVPVLTANGLLTMSSESSASIQDVLWSFDGDAKTGYSIMANEENSLCVFDNVLGIGSYFGRWQYDINGKSELINTSLALSVKLYSDNRCFDAAGLLDYSSIELYKRIEVKAQYNSLSNEPAIMRNYMIVAKGSDGKAYAMSSQERGKGLAAIEVDVSNDTIKLPAYMNEKEFIFRTVNGENLKGFWMKNLATGMYLGINGDTLNAASSYVNAGKWSWYAHEKTYLDVFLENESEIYLRFDEENKCFVADSNTDYSETLIFERKELGGVTGDVNNNGSVGSGDAALLLRYIAGMVALTTAQLKNSDANSDGVVNTGDVAMILKYVVGLVDILGV